MIIFRGAAIYLALGGLVAAFVLMRHLTAPPPKMEHLVEPPSNPYERMIAASGIIEAVDKNIAIGVPQPGLVNAVYVQVGHLVQEGQPLFQIDHRELKAELQVQEANVQVALAHLNRLKDQLARLESVQDPRAVSQEDLKTKHHDVLVAEAQLAAAVALVKQSKLLIDRLTVCAPKEGIILQNAMRKGEYVSTATPVMILGNLEQLQVRADIDEQNACHFSAETPAVAFPKNNPHLAIPLRFDRIEPYVIPKHSLTGAGDERVDTRVLQVIYLFDRQSDFTLYVGQQVDVFIQQVEAGETT